MSDTYVLPAPDFTPAPGWEHIMSATPELAYEHALGVYDDVSHAFSTECKGRHILMSLDDEIASNATMQGILTLHSQIATFLSRGQWLPDCMNALRSSVLSADLKRDVAPSLRIIHAVHRPLPFSDAARAWAEHAIQPVGTDRVSYRDALADWLMQTDNFRQEPEFPNSFRGVSLRFNPPTVPDTNPPREDFGYVWDDVSYDPDLGYRAALHVIRQAHAGDRWRRAYRAARLSIQQATAPA